MKKNFSSGQLPEYEKKETSKVQFWKLFTRSKTIETIECDGKDITKILKTLSK